MPSSIASPITFLSLLLGIAFQGIAATPKCDQVNKTVTITAWTPFHTYCTLDIDSTNDMFIWKKDQEIIGSCSIDKCQRNFSWYDVLVSKGNPKLLSLYISEVTPSDKGEYSISITNKSLNVHQRIFIMNLKVVLPSLEEPECAIIVWKDKSDIDLSCKVKNLVRHKGISISIILYGNTSLVDATFKPGYQTRPIAETSNELTYKIGSMDLLMGTLPYKCTVSTEVEGKQCSFTQIVQSVDINKDEYLYCSAQGSPENIDVWLIKMFEAIKLLPTPKKFAGEEILHGSRTALAICGTETNNAIRVNTVLKVVMNDYDTCYTAYVSETLTNTTFRISSCAFTTLIADATSGFGDVGINATTLTTQYTISLLSTSTKPVDLDIKSTFRPADVSEDRKYEKIFYMISTLAFLCSIVTCLSIVRRHTNKSTKKHLRSQYHSRNHRLTLGSEIADNTETASTDLIALHHLDPSTEVQSSLIRSHDQDRGEFSRSWLSSQSQETHPALPPRGTCRSSNQKTSAEFHFYSTEYENGKFPSLEPPEIDNKNKDSEGGKAKADALNRPENIYNTVSDEMDERLGASVDISLISDSASICLDYKEAPHGSKPDNDFARAMTGGSHPEVNSSNLRTESDCNSSREVCVERLYAKPNKKTKSNSFSTSVVEENFAVSLSPEDSSDYEELRN